MRNWTSELWILHSNALNHWATETLRWVRYITKSSIMKFLPCDKTENIFLHFFTKLKSLLFYFHWTSWPLRVHKDYKTFMHWSVDSLKLTGGDGRSKQKSDIKSPTKTQKMNSFSEWNLIENSKKKKSHHHLQEYPMFQNLSQYGLLMKIPW